MTINSTSNLLDNMKRAARKDFILAVLMIIGGLAVCGISLMYLVPGHDQIAQATQPTDSSPKSPEIPAGKDHGPADSLPGGTRPTTPAPEPARPDNDAQKAGVQPALPPAPAEKMGEPIRN